MSSAIKGSAWLLLLASCGNYSDEDIAFVEALPNRLQIVLPRPEQAVCAHPSAVATSAQTQGDELNAIIGQLLALIDLVRSVSPSSRSPDGRSWGPWPDQSHPGFKFEVVMQRTSATAPTGPLLGGPAYTLAFFEQAPAGQLGVTLEAALSGASAAEGAGALVLHFETLRALGLGKPSDPLQPLRVSYDFTGDPKTLQLVLADSVSSLPPFTYGWRGFADGGASFDYAWRSDGGVLTIPANFTAQGAGSAVISGTPPGGPTFTISECWDEARCISFLDDSFNSQGGCAQPGRCQFGNRAACTPAL